MKFIEHPTEPQRLTLAWQSLRPDQRRRYAVGELTLSEFRYLEGTSDFEEARQLGFSGYPAFRLSVGVHTGRVLEPFLRRIPPRTRTDFPKFLQAIGLPPDTNVSDFALLAYSEARDLADGFSLVNQFAGITGPLEFVTEVAGYRYENRADVAAEIGEEVHFVREPSNEFDHAAVRIDNLSGSKLGYVNRLQNLAVSGWMANGTVQGWIARKNGYPTHPRLYVFVAVRGVPPKPRALARAWDRVTPCAPTA